MSTAPHFPPIIDRAGMRRAIAGVDQGDGTGALLISGSFSAAPIRSTTQTVSSISPATSVQTLSNLNANRIAWSVYNGSAGVLFLSFSNTGAPYFAVVPSGANYTLPIAATQAIYGIFSSAAGATATVVDYSP